MPATHKQVPGVGHFTTPRRNRNMRDWKLEIAVTTVTDFAGYTDKELRQACDVIFNHPGVAPEIHRRAEMILQAVST